MDFIINNALEIIGFALGVLFLISVIVVFIRSSPQKRKSMLWNIIYSLVVRAEQVYGSKTGVLKKNAVLAQLYEKYYWLTLFVSQEKLSQWIDDSVVEMTKYFEENAAAAKNIGIETSK